ncbi:RNA 2',3'-cyclic phosphodiesterase [Nanohaloarchaea archaeon H01]|nr:RNA 2',3'-cyclic phosphodiesterase [Nanohaloarchaea archaeon H01]
MARVFSAVDIEDEKLKDELAEVRDRLDLGFKPVPEEKMHITLQFFKDIGEEEMEVLKQALDDIDVSSFQAEMKGIGCFPSRDYIRVVWAGLENDRKMQQLYREVSEHKVQDDNDHSFTPHMTLLRVKNIREEQKKKLRRTIRDFENHEFGTLNVDSVKLFRSDLEQGGSVYSKLYEKYL